MKKLYFIILLSALLLSCDVVHAQLPFIHATTVIPQNPTTNDFVKVVTHVSTPNQGILVDQLYTVTATPQKIHLHGCYWQGMATAIQHYIDTFQIGYLQAGTYSLTHSVYLSSTQQHCSRIDSNFTAATITVNSSVGIQEFEKRNQITLSPNPAVNEVYLDGIISPAVVKILSPGGVRQKELVLMAGEKIDISYLVPGLYFLSVDKGRSPVYLKFIKE